MNMVPVVVMAESAIQTYLLPCWSKLAPLVVCKMMAYLGVRHVGFPSQRLDWMPSVSWETFCQGKQLVILAGGEEFYIPVVMLQVL